MPPSDGGDPQDADVRGEGIADQGRTPERARRCATPTSARTDRRRHPRRERDRRRDRGQDADDADLRKRQVEPVDVDEGEQRRGRDQAAAVEALGEGDPAEHRAARAGRGSSRAPRTPPAAPPTSGAKPGVRRPRTATPTIAGQRDCRWAAESVREDAAGERRDGARGRRAAHAR